MNAASRAGAAPKSRQQHPWATWKANIVAILRDDFREILPGLDEEDIHWEAWRHYYEDGSAPRAAVNRAFERL